MNKPSRDYGRLFEQETDDVAGHVQPRPEVAIEVDDDVDGHCVGHLLDEDHVEIHRVRVADDGTEDVSGHVQPRGDLDINS